MVNAETRAGGADNGTDVASSPAERPRPAGDDGDLESAVAYHWEVLPGVSRTFALTIPQLPRPLDLVVANAYLWCRVADTIEDEPNLDPARKRYFHEALIEVLDGAGRAEDWAEQAQPELTDATIPAERELVGRLPRVVAVTDTFSEPQREAIRSCLTKMCGGMTHFEQEASIAGLADMSELNSYCYYVAGVVGEMLTALFCEHSPEVRARQADLERLATSFGQGLQMTNILKDLWEDYSEGRCWLPRELFLEHGCELDGLGPEMDRAAFNKALTELIGIAHGHLRNALDYALTIPRQQAGIRRFCLWSLGLAILTLRKLTRHLDFTSGEEVKISKLSVASTIASTNIFIRHDRPFRFLFDLAARSVPRVPVASGFVPAHSMQLPAG